MSAAYIVEAVRTAGGRRKGALAEVHPADLGATVLDALVTRAGIDPGTIEDVLMGCVTQGGEQAFAFGRNCVLASGLPDSVPSVTIDRQCGSSQQALQFAAQAVMSGTQDLVIAAGTESMTRVPMFSNMSVYEKMGIGTGPFAPSIQKRYGVPAFSQFTGAQMVADRHDLTREAMDRFALDSHRKAAAAIQTGAFDAEIVPVTTANGAFAQDEGVRFDATLEGIGALDPLTEGGTITAGNASQMTDGASGVLVASEAAIKTHGLTPLARIHAFGVSAGDPVVMLEEPLPGTRRLLARTGLSLADIDLYEVNEAFASIPMAWAKALEADPAKLNVNGGAIALGHPLGASGTKLMTTLIHALKARGGRYGLQTMCEGGGMANVMIVEAM
ncbi:acetyl-CoA C-acetyltransferase [Novosphingobium mangrovi (ex Hu et al. 2023)]|uniref:Acetyl-CoA C-acetyltransferase n=1 Tax=Novosphingobium mangrovi (ex Hu et al. 2023) TaxID=2930094 RepID=A0ABT0AGN6_9SPHN|nr:acetyl-CoA C-acetyltransferase [Novosphingobium mangrovi (ex Hu et al. 2023)]MCJ1962342.1 acetyl-CoA C-acetyltransferase [Novosphingobium mangrovi (ex Hu et al. 2023)]